MATDTAQLHRAGEAHDSPFLAPVESPRGIVKKALYWLMRRQFGMVPTPMSVFVARMPLAFGQFFGKVSKLDKKLELPFETAMLVRERVQGLNGCAWCMDFSRWYVVKNRPEIVAKLDAVHDYRTSTLINDRERAALDMATELTRDHHVRPETFAEVARHFSEREVCDIVWCVSSEHLYNINNHGLNIGSDGFCKLPGTSWAAAGQAP